MSGSGAGPSRIAKEVESEVQWLYVDAGLCPGVVLDFPGPVLTYYPLHLHNFIELGFSPQYWTQNCEHLIVRSAHCHRVPRSNGHPCSECASLNTSTAIQKL